jgi:ketosteroid isomerase-like protein
MKKSVSCYLNGLIIVTSLVLAACSGSPEDERLDMDAERMRLEKILENQRQAHLELDADRLVENIAESLLSIDASEVAVQSREQVREMFSSYFQGAKYHAWEDLEPPTIRVSSGRDMAWIVRRVRADREEPDGAGGRRRRQLVSAYTSTFEKLGGEWRMTSVTSTFSRTPTVAQ